MNKVFVSDNKFCANSVGTVSEPYRIVHFPTCESTHSWALNNSAQLQTEFGLTATGRPVRISTDLQTRGIGQRLATRSDAQEQPPNGKESDAGVAAIKHKSWISSPGNVLVTFVHQWPLRKIDQMAQLQQVASLAVVNVLKQFELEAKIKWVNDILVNGRKICGILCESTGWSLPSEAGESTDELFTAVLISIGLNVLSTPSLKSLNENEQQLVTCIATELGAMNSHEVSTASAAKLAISQHHHQAPNAHATKEVASVASVSLPSPVPDLHNSAALQTQSNIPNVVSAAATANRPVLTSSSVLDSLSHELYRMISQYELRGFTPIHSALTPILYGLGQTVTVRNPAIHRPHPSREGSSLNEQPNELQGQMVGLSPTTGFLLLKLFDHDNKSIIIEILTGHLSIH